MGEYKVELFKRLALLFKQAQGYLGDSLQILFIGFGDAGFKEPIEVPPLGAGPILDEYLAAMTHDTHGGGNYIESADMAALYVHNLLDTSSVKSAHFFICTNEGCYDPSQRGDVKRVLGLDLSEDERDMKKVFRALQRRMGVYLIRPTYTARMHPVILERITKQWNDLLGEDYIIGSPDPRRVVDQMLAVAAKITGQYPQFTTHLQKRQGQMQHGAENIAGVHASVAHIRGAPEPPEVEEPKPLGTAGAGSVLGASRLVPGTLAIGGLEEGEED